MGRDKGAIQNDIDQTYQSLGTQLTKQATLRAALVKLDGADVEADWKGESHSHIKHTYHLAGKPYSDMSDTEKELIETLNKGLKGKRDDMKEVVEGVLKTVDSLIIGYQQRLRNLDEEMKNAK